MISFFAFHGNADLKRTVVDDLVRDMANGHLANGSESGRGRLCLISLLAGGGYDLAAAHRRCGFPAPLLLTAEAVFEGLAPEEAAHFTLAAMNAAAIDRDLANIAGIFAEWMFAEAVAELGPSSVRHAAREAPPAFRILAYDDKLSPAQRQKAKALVKKARRRALQTPTPEERLVASAMHVLFDNEMELIGPAIHWLAQLSAEPTSAYRRFACKLVALLASAEPDDDNR